MTRTCCQNSNDNDSSAHGSDTFVLYRTGALAPVLFSGATSLVEAYRSLGNMMNNMRIALLLLSGAAVFSTYARAEKEIYLNGIITSDPLPSNVRVYQVGKPYTDDVVPWKGVGLIPVNIENGQYGGVVSLADEASSIVIGVNVFGNYVFQTKGLLLEEGKSVYTANFSLSAETEAEPSFILKIYNNGVEIDYERRPSVCFIAKVPEGEGSMFFIDTNYFALEGNRFYNVASGEYSGSCSVTMDGQKLTVRPKKNVRFRFSLPLVDESGNALPVDKRVVRIDL